MSSSVGVVWVATSAFPVEAGGASSLSKGGGLGGCAGCSIELGVGWWGGSPRRLWVGSAHMMAPAGWKAVGYLRLSSAR